MQRDAPKDSSAPETGVPPAEASPDGNGDQTITLDTPPQVIPLAAKRRRPYQVSPVHGYQTDRYRLVTPYTRL